MEKGMSDMTENNNFQNRQEQNGNPEKKAASFPVYNNIYDAFSQGDGNRTAQENSRDSTHAQFSQAASQGHYEIPAKKKKTQFLTKRAGAILLSCCVLLSFCFGMAGMYAGNRLFGGTETEQADKSTQGTPSVPNNNTGDSSNTALNYAEPDNDKYLSIAEIAAMNANAVVEIVTEIKSNYFYQQYTQEGAGSGVIVTADGYIVTNNHVIEDADSIHVRLKNSELYEATLIGTDPENDIAVIKIEAENLTTATLGDSDQLQVGELAVAIGNPLGTLGGSVTDGIISALDREITIDGETMRLLQTNAAVNPGNSGGGLFNAKGELIGIVNAKSSGTNVEGLGFAIPINSVKQIIEDLVNDGYVHGKFTVGITSVVVSDQWTANKYGVSKFGLYIYEVNKDSNADKAGLQAGDRIISVDGTEIDSFDTLKSLLDEHAVNDVLTFVIERAGEEISVDVTLYENIPSGEST